MFLTVTFASMLSPTYHRLEASSNSTDRTSRSGTRTSTVNDGDFSQSLPPLESSGAKDKQEINPQKQAQSNHNSSPTEKEENATTEKRKPIPAAMNAIAYDLEKQNTPPQASANQNAGKKDGAEGGPGEEGIFFGVKRCGFCRGTGATRGGCGCAKKGTPGNNVNECVVGEA